MVVDAMLGHLYGDADPDPAGAEPYELPENLARLFAGKGGAAASEEKPCCSVSEQRGCCEDAEQDECCGTSPERGCGCW